MATAPETTYGWSTGDFQQGQNQTHAIGQIDPYYYPQTQWNACASSFTNNKEGEKKMKFYRAIKDSFLWDAGAILKLETRNGATGYCPIDDLWDATEYNEKEYISQDIIEESPEWFERVYETSFLNKICYKTKEEAKKLWAGTYKKGKK